MNHGISPGLSSRDHRRGLRGQARRRARNAAACGGHRKGGISRRGRPQLTRTPGGWSTSSTPNRAGWCRSTAPRPTRSDGRSSRRCWRPSAARNDRLPIFLFGDQLTAEMVPASVLKHANAFMRLFEDSFEFLARAIARAAELYLDRLPPPMFKALMDYTLHASYSWHTPGHGGGVAFRKSPVGQLFYEFFGENTLRSDISVSVGQLGSLLDHTGPIAAGERNAARIFGTDETLFVVGGTSTSNKIVWHGMVEPGRPRALRPQLPQVDPALADHDRGDARSISSPRATGWGSSGRSRGISSRPSRSARRSPRARSRRRRAARSASW